MSKQLSSLLSSYQEKFDPILTKSIDSFGPKTRLRDAIEYSLKNGGKRFRPAVVFMVAKALGGDVAEEAAVAVEFFHTASLIADDLPCMDNDEERRGVPTLHKAFDETTALLASYALIAAGYEYIRLNGERLGRNDLCVLALQSATKNTGIFGATGGQYCDIFSEGITEERILSAIDKKTGALFELSFLFGWLFGGGSVSDLELVKRAALHFGRLFQISDDFLDLDQDSQKGAMNYPAAVGPHRATQVLSEELSSLKIVLKDLQLDSEDLLTLVAVVEERIENLKK